MQINFTSTNINSSIISAIDFNRGVLTVQLKNGKMYSYKDVPSSTAIEFLTANSVGNYFNTYIRNEFDCIFWDAA